MKNDFGIRVRGAEEPFETFEDPIEARMALHRIEESLHQSVAGTYEIVHRYPESIVEAFPDGRTYVTGVKDRWIALYKT